VAQDSGLNFTVPAGTFSDADVGDTLTLSATLADGSPLPSWITFNPATGTFSGTPGNGDVGSLSIRVTATDGSNTSISTSFGLT
ncbi:putative Ig domain-containing protein, partial [Pectobacterium brasiliense]|uniref:putative Ig domain-containing protein n=1 Tax=Pectobacterium brasiliense TaxID=180957 RepID=UPI001968F882